MMASAKRSDRPTQDKLRGRKGRRISLQIDLDVYDSVKEAAGKSGWRFSDQVRYELAKPRGLWRYVKPWAPGQDTPGKT